MEEESNKILNLKIASNKKFWKEKIIYGIRNKKFSQSNSQY